MQIRNFIDRFLERFLIILLAVMTITVLWQVASRYLLRDPSSWTDELVRFLFMWVGLLGAAYITGLKMHLAIDILPTRVNPKNQKRLNTLIYTLVAIFAFLTMVIGGIRLVYITLFLDQTSPTLEIPLGYVYLVVPISGIFIIYYSILNIIFFQDRNMEEKMVDESI